MASEKEEFITKKYIPTGAPIVENDRTLIYKVRCMEEPGSPVAILKMYANGMSAASIPNSCSLITANIHISIM